MTIRAISPSGKRWTIVRAWRDAEGRPGIALVGPNGQSTSRYLLHRVPESGHALRIGVGWVLEATRSTGAVVGCPMCGHQFGGMSRCPWDEVPLWPLAGVGERPDDGVAVAFYEAIGPSA
jgi:hypothetical protein